MGDEDDVVATMLVDDVLHRFPQRACINDLFQLGCHRTTVCISQFKLHGRPFRERMTAIAIHKRELWTAEGRFRCERRAQPPANLFNLH